MGHRRRLPPAKAAAASPPTPAAAARAGELFPGPSKTTRAYLHSEESVVDALEEAGFSLTRTEMTGTNFYFSRLLEATRK